MRNRSKTELFWECIEIGMDQRRKMSRADIILGIIYLQCKKCALADVEITQNWCNNMR